MFQKEHFVYSLGEIKGTNLQEFKDSTAIPVEVFVILSNSWFFEDPTGIIRCPL